MSRDEVDLHHDTVVRTVRKVLSSQTKDVHGIEDVAQDVLIICWKDEPVHGSRSAEHLRGFVGRVALNRYRSLMRKRKLVSWSEELEHGSRKDDPAQIAEKSEEARALEDAIDGLPDRYRETTRLRVMESWSYKRIARQMKVGVNTAKTKVRRAIPLLEKAVKRSVSALSRNPISSKLMRGAKSEAEALQRPVGVEGVGK